MPRTPPKQARRRAAAVLLIECDSPKLKTQGLSQIDNVQRSIEQACPRTRVETVRSAGEADLLACLAGFKRANAIFSTVIMIGHSNRSGIQLSTDRFVPWPSIPAWLGPFHPSRIILIACEGGRWLPCRAMFIGIPSLKQIFGSPIRLTGQQASVIAFLIPHLVGTRRVRRDSLRIAQIAGFFLTGGLIFRRTRGEFLRTGESDGLLWQVTEELLTRA